jgi:uncharacterized Fe-S cluster-containing MiaB family protein
MRNAYIPWSHEICHHAYNNGGCTFCGYKTQKRSVSPVPVNSKQMIEHFDSFSKVKLDNIKQDGRLIIAPNGSWFTQVPLELREHIYNFLEKENIPILKYESRATLFNPELAENEFYVAYKHLFPSQPEIVNGKVKNSLDALALALGEIAPRHIISFGLEVANDADLKTINKGCCLEDYVLAEKIVHNKNASVGCNILIAPPGVKEPVKKAFETARFGAEVLGASELLVMPCIPMLGTPGYDAWINAKWNPVSATAASEVFRTIKSAYPDINFKYIDLRVFSKHGRFGRFKRNPGKWSEEEKERERAKVQRIAEKFF